ncbi:hypothetical protein PHYC_02324 [Phycisphaerales bacterium]|nr:hypothetical protein PHYC_02324 [Phycisphaerales bacterium]
MIRTWFIAILVGLLAAASCATPPQAQTGSQPAAVYFPPRGEWRHRDPAQLGFDDKLLADAVAWAKAQETDMPRDFSTQAAIFGRSLGPVPTTRALTNGVIIRRGYIVAEWGEVNAVDPTYSVAKSYLSTILGLTIDRGLIKSIDDPVAQYIHDGGYDPANSPHNAKVTWRHHATQTSEWEGTLFGKPSTFIGREEFGRGEMKPRDIKEPGTHYEYNDVRINRMSLSLLRLWKRPLPDVLKTEIMDPIGASGAWVYHGYDNATVEVDGKPMKSVSGGTRWGGGLWMSTLDHARFGLLILRRGEWRGRRIISESWIKGATSQQGLQPGYGYLWWLNTGGRWPEAPRTSFAALGAGSNSIWIDPEHDLVVVWRWHKGGEAQGEFYKRILAALMPGE